LFTEAATMMESLFIEQNTAQCWQMRDAVRFGSTPVS